MCQNLYIARKLLKLAKDLADNKTDLKTDEKPIKIDKEVKSLIQKFQSIIKPITALIEKKLKSLQKTKIEYKFAAIVAIFESIVQNLSLKTINQPATQNMLRPFFFKTEKKLDDIKDKNED